jgi:hypothetical protein
MTDYEADVLTALLRIAIAQERIADAVAVLVPAQDEPQDEAPQGCPHPEDKRADLGDEWECTVCRTRFLSDTVRA